VLHTKSPGCADICQTVKSITIERYIGKMLTKYRNMI